MNNHRTNLKFDCGVELKAPWAIGDPVWFIRDHKYNPKIEKTHIDKIVFKNRGVFLKLACNSQYETSCSSIGKNIFFNEADAIKALKTFTENK